MKKIMMLEKNLYKKIMESIFSIICVDVIIINEKNQYLLVKREKMNLLKINFGW